MTDRERLESLKRNKEDYVWLIEQAKRKQELERENKRYREALEQIEQKRMTYADMAGVLRIARKALEGEE